jgi:mersacidin/lichenicidin family type 2 lantibiotic
MPRAASPFYDHPVAELFALSTLDLVIEMATAVARDFFQRSRAYRKLPEEIADKIIGFRSFLGSHPDWPSLRQRSSIYKILSDGDQLCSHAVSFRLAALAVSRRTPSENQFFTPAFLDSIAAFRAYIRKMDGRALETGVRQVRTLFNTSIEVLMNGDLAHVFGVDAPPGEGWPFGARTDPNGACLLANINDTVMRRARGKLNASVVFAKQRIAHHGARAMVEMVSGPERLEGERLSALIQTSNSWAQALRDLVPHVVRYWKRPDALDELTEVEKAQVPPNPAGVVDLQGLIGPTTADTGQTCTGGAICCCDSIEYCATDDLECEAAEVTTTPLENGGHVDDWCDA